MTRFTYYSLLLVLVLLAAMLGAGCDDSLTSPTAIRNSLPKGPTGDIEL